MADSDQKNNFRLRPLLVRQSARTAQDRVAYEPTSGRGRSGFECMEVRREPLQAQEAKDFTIRGFHKGLVRQKRTPCSQSVVRKLQRASVQLPDVFC